MTLVARRNFQCSGVIVLECLIDSVTFANRCAAKQQENNSTARGEYAFEVLGAAHSEPVPNSTCAHCASRSGARPDDGSAVGV